MEIKVRITTYNKFEWDVPLPEVPESSSDDAECWNWKEELEGGLQGAFENTTQDHDLVIDPMKHTLDNYTDETTYQNQFKDVLTKWFDEERARLYKRLSYSVEDEVIIEALETMRDEVRDNISNWFLPTDLTHDYEENEVEYA